MTTQQQTSVDQKTLEQLCINTIRTLAMDGVQKANSDIQVRQWLSPLLPICSGHATCTTIHAILHGSTATVLFSRPATRPCFYIACSI